MIIVGRTVDEGPIPPEHAALVRRIAWRIARQLPSGIAQGLWDDLLADGYVGYLEARARFRTGEGVEFAAYAQIRIRGAILDGLRRLDIMSRDDRRARRKLLDVRATLTGTLSRPPTEDELAAHIGLPVERVALLLNGATVEVTDPFSHDFVSIPAPEGELEAPRFEEAMRTAALIDQALRALEPREEQVVRRHFFEDKTLKQVGGELGISESRVCQIFNSALVKLRVLYEQMARADSVLRQEPHAGGEVEAGGQEFARELVQTGTALDELIGVSSSSDDPKEGRS